MKDKMKITGYLLIFIAVILSVVMLLGSKSMDKETGLTLVKYWGGAGITLLTVNAGKRLGGHIVMNQNGDGK